MSSFLDSTGLSRLVSKITDYFAKKDGTYPDMTVGNVSNVVPIAKLPAASSVTNGDTTHIPTADAVYKDTVQKVDGYANYTSSGATGYKALGFFKPPATNDDISAVIKVTYTCGSAECRTQYVLLRLDNTQGNYSCSYSVLGPNLTSAFSAVEFQVHYSSSTHNAWLYAYCSNAGYFGMSIQILSATRWDGVSQMDKFSGYLGTAPTESSTGITKITPTRYATPYFGGSDVGSASQPVYVDANGQVQPCGFNADYTTSSASALYWKLMTLTLPSYPSDPGWSGCVLDISWRAASGTETGNGELRLSFGENNDSTIKGYAIASFTRGGVKPATSNVQFIVKSIGSNKYEIWCYVGNWSMVGARLRYGGISSVDYTMSSSSSDPSGTTIPWKLPSYT